MPEIDEEELRKYLQNNDDDEESQQNKTSPQKSKRVRHKIKTSQDKSKKVISKDPPQNYLVQGDDFKKLQKKAKKLGASSLDYSKRKNYKYIIEYDNKKIHFGSANTKIQFVETSISPKPRKFQTKMDNLHTKFPLIQIIGLSNF